MSSDRLDSARPLGEISQAPAAFDQFMDRHQKSIAALAILIVLAVAAFLIHRSIRHSGRLAAGAELSKATEPSSLLSIVKNHADTPAAGSASVLLATRQWADGQQEAAIGTLRKFLADFPDHPARPTAEASLATKLASQGKTDEARPLFEKLTTDPASRFLAPFALISLGDIEKSAGDETKAAEHYQQARNLYPRSSFVETANRRIANLKAKAPVEIDPPPAPEEDAAPSAPGIPPFLTPGTPIAPEPVEIETLPDDIPADPAPADNGNPTGP